MSKICIVTPDLFGPIQNGGIGTANYHLLLTLAKQGHDVTVLFTCECEREDFAYWKAYYRKHNVKFEHLTEEQLMRDFFEDSWYMLRARAVYKWLSARDGIYEWVHFMDFYGNGFFCMQAKNTLKLFEKTVFTVMMHSPMLWINEGMRDWGVGRMDDVNRNYMERYSCENADLTLAPSQHMMDWATAHGWHSKERRLVPYCFADKTTHTSVYEPDRGHLCFFGRLEKRKGIDIFCKAVKGVIEVGNKAGLRKISFLGRNGMVDGLESEKYIDSILEGVGIQYELHTGLNAHEAIDYIRSHKAIAVMPSLVDNLPLTVIEAIENKLAFITSNTGGIPEMCNPVLCFDFNIKALTAKLMELPRLNFAVEHIYSSETAALKWDELHRQTDTIQYRSMGITANPLVTVCVPHYNMGKYLPDTLDALSKQSYKQMDVVVIDDCSTEPESLRVLDDMKRKHPNFKFISNEKNEFLSITRNRVAQKADGAYIVFVDSDNVPFPNMIADMVYAIEKSGCDCLTCYSQYFYGDGMPNKSNSGKLVVVLGAIQERNMLDNQHGDANAIFRTSIFSEIEGFTDPDRCSGEDWGLFNRMALKGYRLDIIPKVLFYYRVRDNSMWRTVPPFLHMYNGIRPYLYDSPDFIRRLILQYSVPRDKNGWRLFEYLLKDVPPSVELPKPTELDEDGVFVKFILWLEQRFPIGTRRRRWIDNRVLKFLGE